MSKAPLYANHCQANTAHIRQSRPHSGLGVQVKTLKTFQGVPSSLQNGPRIRSSQILVDNVTKSVPGRASTDLEEVAVPDEGAEGHGELCMYVCTYIYIYIYIHICLHL